MRDKEEFYSILNRIDGHDYCEYGQLVGDFDFARYVLKFTSIHSDGEGKTRQNLFLLRVPQIIAAFPEHLFSTPVRRVSLEDYLTRKIAEQIASLARYDSRGISKKRLFVANPGQKILPRSSMVVTDEYIEARVYVDLPAVDGKIAGEEARQIFFEDIPSVVNSALIHCNLNGSEVEGFVDQMEDTDHIRRLLPTKGWVAFVADGAMVKRAENSDLPDVSQWMGITVDPAAAVPIDLPNAGTIRGIGIPVGITVVLGDAHSGRVDLLHAIADGIYNHIPGDGREFVVSVPDLVYVQAEPGRSVQRVDISAFVRPNGDATLTADFSAARAEALTAEAASFVEALEAGARVIALDESDSSGEFLALGAAAAAVVPDLVQKQVPLSVRARALVDELGISLIIGGANAAAQFIPVADCVLKIDNFKITDITASAKAAVRAPSIQPPPANLTSLVDRCRKIIPSSIDPSAGLYDALIDAPSVHELKFGRYTIDLSGCRQLAEIYQTLTIGRILYYAKLRYLDEPRPIREVLDLIDRDLSTEGLESLSRDLRGDLARPRRYEIAAALNRLRSLRILRETPVA